MNRIVTTALPAFLFLTQVAFATPLSPVLPVDSVGVVRQDGKLFILHRVDQGQTLYAVAKRYGTSVDAIKSANPDLIENAVRYDQLLRVPAATVALSRKDQREAEKAAKREEKEKLKASAEAEQPAEKPAKVVAKAEPKPDMEATYKPKATKPVEKAEKPTRPTAAASTGVHTVESGQTLYSLAVRYSVTMAEIRRWNNLGADGIQVGQSLIVSEKAYEAKKGDESSTARAKATPTKSIDAEPVKLEAKPIVTPEPLATPGTKPTPKPAEKKPVEKEAEPKATAPRSDNDPTPTAAVRKGNVKSEVGFADQIDGNDASTKYLALHRSAPVGTLVQVRNDITNQSLYVKVIGKLPDTGINNQVLIRLSGRAFEKLSPNGQRFRAEVSYSN
ncbi:LysM peptidoglycan-binding domain-containing protein [Fibrella aquatica]|uniref:LysM peptidoglycan-binding domain-containing protein n=1 Tax=Fibrella aquatica TaxID=3242487 RepID=UPI003522E575